MKGYLHLQLGAVLLGGFLLGLVAMLFAARDAAQGLGTDSWSWGPVFPLVVVMAVVVACGWGFELWLKQYRRHPDRLPAVEDGDSLG